MRADATLLRGTMPPRWPRANPAGLLKVGPRVPAVASSAYGQPFLDIFEAAGRDFYAIDPHLFSPAEVILQNIESGSVFRFGRIAPDILRESFEL